MVSTHRTTTEEVTENAESTVPSTVVVLEADNSRRVTWSADTVDNENMGRKSSKCCCVYSKPRKFDSEGNPEDSSDDEDHKCDGRNCFMAPDSYHGNCA